MRSVNVAELKNRLSTYLGFARNGEEIVIRDRNVPVAKLIPFVAGDATDDELLLVAEGKMRLPAAPGNLDELWKIRTANVPTQQVIETISRDRGEER